MDISQKIALVTGASTGIGAATARLLTKEGAKVALVARSTDKLGALSKELPGSFVVTADLSDEKEVRRAVREVVSHYKGIDILVNNAGRGYSASIEKISLKNFRHLFELNLIAPLIAMQDVIPEMRKRGGGVIVNVSSNLSHMSLPNLGGYSSLKRALNGLGLTAGEELKSDHISVVTVYPSVTDTEFAKNILREASDVRPYYQRDHLPKADSAEYVAQKIVQGIKSGTPEVYVHDWMEK